jgi:hypothetical protein
LWRMSKKSGNSKSAQSFLFLFLVFLTLRLTRIIVHLLERTALLGIALHAVLRRHHWMAFF